ncbi:MAG: hypothetical protein Q9207_005332, partial [Kuettlingeria erythrocarpa]
IYTWPTCTLRELSHLLTSSLPSLVPSPAIGTRLAYRLIFPDTRPPPPHLPPNSPPRYIAKDIGTVVIGGDGPGILPTEEEKEVLGEGAGLMKGELQGEPEKTLRDVRFVVGDWVDCAVIEGRGDGGVAPLPRRGDFMGAGGGPRGGYGGGRENGFGGGRGRGGGRGGFVGGGAGAGRLGGEGLPSGEWRRGEALPDGRGYGGYGRGRGRAY